MSAAHDVWYVRYPDGRVLRAAGTTVLRNHLEAGRIPPGSMVRRSPAEAWTSPERVRELADLVGRPGPGNGVEPVTVASRLDATRLKQVDVWALLQELLAALDSTLVARKLWAAVGAGLALGALLAVLRSGLLPGTAHAPAWEWALAGAALLVVVVLTIVLSRLTFIELSRLRPGRWREALAGLRGLAGRLLLLEGGGLAGVVGLIVLFRWLPTRLLAGGPEAAGWLRVVGAHAVSAAGMVLEVGLWPIAALLLLLGPLLVVEGCSAWSGLRQWLGLVRRHFVRALLYEALAVGLALLAGLAFALPLAALSAHAPDPRLLSTAVFTRDVLAGLLLTLLLAYLIVANVFIYLNLRYEAGAGR
jgi:hypothetical protein